MDEWAQYGLRGVKWAVTLIGASYLLKKLEEWKHTRRMRTQVYAELVGNYEKLANRRHVVTSIKGIERLSAERFLKDLNLEFAVYNHYQCEGSSELFRLEEAGPIASIYARYRDINLMAQNDWGDGFEANRIARRALAEFDKQVRLGKLNMGILERVSHPKIYDFLLKMKVGELDSHERDLDPIP